MTTEPKVSQKTLAQFHESLGNFIAEYLHSVRDERHKTFMISPSVINKLRDNCMGYLKDIMDGSVSLIILEQRRNNEEKPA